MVTAFSSPRMIAQKAQVPDITPDPTAPTPPATDLVDDASCLLFLVQRHIDPHPRPRYPDPNPLRRDLEPDAGAGALTEEAPAFGDRVDQLETAPVLVVPAGLAPVRQADASIVDDVHVHERAQTHYGHRHLGRVGGVLHRVGH